MVRRLVLLDRIAGLVQRLEHLSSKQKMTGSMSGDPLHGGLAKLVNAMDSKSIVERLKGANPLTPTILGPCSLTEERAPYKSLIPVQLRARGFI